MVHHVDICNLKDELYKIHAGDEVYLTGTIYTARDAAHKKLKELILNDKPLPLSLSGAVIYYAGPTPEREGQIIGSCGPTTSSRMDTFTPLMLDMGLCAMIGKGPRSEEVRQSILKNGAAYFCAIGGAGALNAAAIKKYEVIAFDELGCESIKKMEIENFYTICGIDMNGNSIFEKGIFK